jgi:hypothetical protein
MHINAGTTHQTPPPRLTTSDGRTLAGTTITTEDLVLDVPMSGEEVRAAVHADRIGAASFDDPAPRLEADVIMQARDLLRDAVAGGRLLDLGWLNRDRVRVKYDHARKRYNAGRVTHPFQDRPYALRLELGARTCVLLIVPKLGSAPQAFLVQEFIPALIDGKPLAGEHHRQVPGRCVGRPGATSFMLPPFHYFTPAASHRPGNTL